jgi:hypothetical protein
LTNYFSSYLACGRQSSSVLTFPPIGQRTLHDRLSRSFPATSWAVTHVLITDKDSAIASAIRAGRCASVSDGSLEDQCGTAIWAIEAESSVHRCTGEGIPPAAASKDNRCKGVNIVPGATTYKSLYRSEVAGVLGIATMIRETCAFHDITAGTVYLGCDGLSALINFTDIDYVAKPASPHFDLITATRATLQQYPVKWIPHVLGHQDDDPDAFLVDRWATLSIEMDDQAKEHWAESVDKPRDRRFTISGEPWAFGRRTKRSV